MNTIDARGRACPEPVVMTRNALSSDASGANIIVDNECAIENITRYAANHGYGVSCTEENGEFTLTIEKK